MTINMTRCRAATAPLPTVQKMLYPLGQTWTQPMENIRLEAWDTENTEGSTRRWGQESDVTRLGQSNKMNSYAALVSL